MWMCKAMKQETKLLILVALAAYGIMAVVDGIIQPGYAAKSAIKIALFLGLPLLTVKFCPGITLKGLFRFQRKGFLSALLLGLGVYGVILGGYFLVRNFYDFSGIAGTLSQNAGVNRDNFLFVSLYISFVNSLLEEFFFRGFLFMNLKPSPGKGFAHGFSSILFAAYHVAMMVGWFSPWLFALVMAGLAIGSVIFNTMNEKLGAIYPSWLTHMFANFAINTIGFMLMA